MIDPGDEAGMLADFIKKNSLDLSGIVATHGHFDHITAVKKLRESFAAKFYLHEADLFLLTRTAVGLARAIGYDAVELKPDVAVKDGDIIEFGPVRLKVIHTPGHTPGCICLYCTDEGVLFSGDTLFNGDVGRCDLPGGSYRQIVTSIKEKLFTLPDDTIVYPGHGSGTTIGGEKSDTYMSRILDEGQE